MLDRVYSSRLLRNGGGIGLLSPLFGCHHPSTPRLMARLSSELNALGRGVLSFDAIGVNAYNLHGRLALDDVDNCKQNLQAATGYPSCYLELFVTETGMLERTGDGTYEAVALESLRESNETFREDSDVEAEHAAPTFDLDDRLA